MMTKKSKVKKSMVDDFKGFGENNALFHSEDTKIYIITGQAFPNKHYKKVIF